MALQRTFSGFPTGYPALSLFLLRIAVGGTASWQACLLIATRHGAANTGVVFALLALLAGLALIIGLMTPIASLILAAGAVIATVDANVLGHLPLFESGIARLEFFVMSVALLGLGPGAWSLDARLYGRREIKVNGNGS